MERLSEAHPGVIYRSMFEVGVLGENRAPVA